MKTILPWFYLIAATTSQSVWGESALIDYRQGNYFKAGNQLATEDKDPLALFYLGKMRLYGYGLLKNDGLAFSYIQKSADKGVLAAQQWLARYYLYRNQPADAYQWFKKAAAAKNLEAQLYCIAANLYGFGTRKNIDAARNFAIEAARSGHPLAQYTLGMDFLNSRNGGNQKLGVIWLTKAADQGFMPAVVQLAEIYLSKRYGKQDLEKAESLLKQAASKQNPKAMFLLGDLALQDKDYSEALLWLNKASNMHFLPAQVALAKIYAFEKGPAYKPQEAFLLMLKAAQEGSTDAQFALVDFYKKGIGTVVNADLAQSWQEKAQQSIKNIKNQSTNQNTDKTSQNLQKEVAYWLSNGSSDYFKGTPYGLNGIYSTWANKQALQNNIYNPAPKMQQVTRQSLYTPKFQLATPDTIPIYDYFNFIAPSLAQSSASEWYFPIYPIDRQVQALENRRSYVLEPNVVQAIFDDAHLEAKKSSLPPLEFSYADDYLRQMTRGWWPQANAQQILTFLYQRAILGDSEAQFKLGQLYEYGFVVAKNIPQAITYYELAALQQDVRAEYNLGVLYLQGKTDPVDYKKGLSWIIDAAFKGNAYAQYVLGHIYDMGLNDTDGKVLVTPNPQQALAMYYLASANHYGLAQFTLADYLVKEKNTQLSVQAKQDRLKLVKRLYDSAAQDGIVEAVLPLAFYNAMDDNPSKQEAALKVAEQQVEQGNPLAPLLLGIMYERGIAVSADPIKAVYWYEKSNHPLSAFILGTYYLQGSGGLSKEAEKGQTLLQQAADANFPYAYYNLAIIKQQKGESFVADLDKARELGNSKAGLLLADYHMSQAANTQDMAVSRSIYQYFAERGDKEAQTKLAFLYEHGLGGDINLPQAQEWYRLSAEQGYPLAQYLLGQFYQLGKSEGQPNYAEAKKWYEKASLLYSPAAVALGFLLETVDENYPKAKEYYQLATRKNNAVAEYNLGLIFEQGKGEAVDFQKAQLAYQKAADKGVSAAMSRLGYFYWAGVGEEKHDEQKALDWYQKAAALNEPEALYQLGLFAETGVGGQIDYTNSLNYYQRAANLGNDKAKLALARMYQFGLGIPKDTARAAQLYEQLAAHHNAYAQYQLSKMYYDGSAGTKMQDKAKQLLMQASDNGNQQAKKALLWMNAQREERSSFIEPLMWSYEQPMRNQSQAANLMYLEAISEWNRGDAHKSKMILDRLMGQYPYYTPAKKAYQELNTQDYPG